MQTQSLVGAIVDGKFELLSVAGSGGMGTVFKSRQVDLERLVAVKILEPGLLTDPDALKRFEREARAISQLSHAHIAGFYAYGLWDQLPYLAMEWLEGTCLSAFISGGQKFTSERTAKICEQIADALDAVHRAGYVHRDLKPANIMLLDNPEADYVKLLDFGLARVIQSGNLEELTRTGTLIGTPHYFSPEQCRGEKADARSDIYALGCIMYEMLAGEAPFQADTAIGIIHKHLNENAPGLTKQLPAPSPEMEQIISRCLKKNPDDRYQNISELRDDLLAVLSGAEVSSKKSAAHSLSPEALALRKKVLIARYATGAVLLALLGSFAAYQWSASESGTVAKTEVSLKSDHSRKTVLESLDLAERFATQGKIDLFKRIKKAADAALGIDSSETKSRLKTCLGIAADLQKRGDNFCAFAYASQAIRTIDELKGKATQAQLEQILALVATNLDLASRIILKTGIVEKKDWSNSEFADRDFIKKMLALTATSLALNPGACENSTKLACLLIAKTKLPASDDVLICMLRNVWFMAINGQVEKVDASVNKTIEAIDKYQGVQKLRLGPDPCAATFLSALSAAFASNNPSAAVKYAKRTEDLLNTIDLNSLEPEQKIVAATVWSSLSSNYELVGNKDEALRCARISVSVVPLEDDRSAVCYLQLANCLINAGLLAEAEPIAGNVYKFLKASDWNQNIGLNRSAIAESSFQILNGLHKNNAAVKLITDEIAAQRKHIPESVREFANLNTILAQYFVKHSQLSRAAECNRRISEIMPLLKGDERLNYDALLMEHPGDDPKIAKLALADALAYIEKTKIKELKPVLLAAFARMLKYVEPNSELSTKCLQNTEAGCFSMLDGPAEQIDPFALADIINLLGINGAEGLADKIRSSAMEKLPAEKTGPFSAYCIDFVASADSQDGTKYSAPDHAVSVFLDLARDMQNKDNQSASKYAFEALKIIRVLVASNGNLAGSLLVRANEASNIILQTKILPDKYQLDSIIDLCNLELAPMKASANASGGLFDLFTESLEKKDYEYSDKIISGIFLANDFLAEKKQLSALQTLAGKTKSQIVKFYNSGLLLADHYGDIAARLISQPVGARYFLTQSAKLLDELSPEQVNMDPSRVASIWEKDALVASKTSDVSLALAYSKKAFTIRPLRDFSSGQAANALCEALFTAGKYTEGEKMAREFYSFAMSQKDLSAQALELRFMAVRDLYRVLDVQNKLGEAQSTLLQECEWRKKHALQNPLQAAELNVMLAFHKLIHESPQAAYPYMVTAAKYASSLQGERSKLWYSSIMQRHVINIAAKADDAATCSTSVKDMLANQIAFKGSALKSPPGWWNAALQCLKKSGDSSNYAALSDFVKQGFSQLLSEKEPDAGYLGDIVASISALGDSSLAESLKELAQKKLPETVLAQFSTRCNASSQATAQPADAEPNSNGEGKDGLPEGSASPEAESEGKQ